jgi:hypothetical protein
MGLFAALATYLVVAALLIGGAVAGLSVLFAPSETLTARSQPPLVRAVDRKTPPAPKAEPAPQARIVTPPTGTASHAAAPAKPAAGSPAQTAAQQPQQQVSGTAQPTVQAATSPAPPPVKKKKIVRKPPPALQREADTTTLGYSPADRDRRRFIFPFDPGW